MDSLLESLASLGLMFLATGSCFYLVLCVDSNDPGILGKLHRLIYKLVPSFVK